MTGHVVVGFSGSDASEAALHWAADAAAARRVPLRIVGVVERQRFRPDLIDPGRLLEPAGELLEQARREVAARHGELPTSVELVEGDAVHVLADAALADGLLVLGARHLGRLDGAVHAPVSVRAAAASRSTVALIPVATEEAPTGRRGVAVGVDGSEASLEAVHFAAEEADRSGGPLVAVHAWQLPGAWSDVSPYERVVVEAIEEDENLVLAESMAGIRARFPDLELEQVLARGQAVEVLAAVAARCRLLVVGSHGRGAFLRLLLGSVSHSMALGVPCPLVIVRHERLRR